MDKRRKGGEYRRSANGEGRGGPPSKHICAARGRDELPRGARPRQLAGPGVQRQQQQRQRQGQRQLRAQ
eukprot:1185502-Prorocentrum_minimum.AAC.2